MQRHKNYSRRKCLRGTLFLCICYSKVVKSVKFCNLLLFRVRVRVKVSLRLILTLSLTLTLTLTLAKNSDYTTLLVISWNNWFHDFTVTYTQINIQHVFQMSAFSACACSELCTPAAHWMRQYYALINVVSAVRRSKWKTWVMQQTKYRNNVISVKKKYK